MVVPSNSAEGFLALPKRITLKFILCSFQGTFDGCKATILEFSFGKHPHSSDRLRLELLEFDVVKLH